MSTLKYGSLNLSDKEVNDENIIEKLQPLLENSKLKSVDLSFNHITDEGVVKLINFLELNKLKLNSINMEFNDIHNFGAFAFAKSNYIPSELDLRDNTVTFPGAKALIENDKLNALILSAKDNYKSFNGQKIVKITKDEINILFSLVKEKIEKNPIKKMNLSFENKTYANYSFPSLKEISLFHVNNNPQLKDKLKKNPQLLPRELTEDLHNQQLSFKTFWLTIS